MNHKHVILCLLLICIVFLSGCGGKQPPSIDEYNDEALKMTIDVNDEVLPNEAVKMIVYLKSQVPEDVSNVVIGISDPHGIKIKEVDCMNKCKCTVDNNGNVNKTGCSGDFSCSLYGKPSNIKPGIDNGCSYKNIRSLDEKEIDFALKIPKTEEIEGGERTFEPKLTLEYDYLGQSIFYVPILRSDMTSTDKKLQLTQSFGPIHVKIEKGYTTSKQDWEEEGNIFSIKMTVEDVVHPSVTENLKTPTEINQSDFNIYLSHLYTGEDFSPTQDLGRCDFKKKNKQEYTISSNKITLPLSSPLICALRTEDDLKNPAIDGTIRIEYSYKYRYVETKTINLVTELT